MRTVLAASFILAASIAILVPAASDAGPLENRQPKCIGMLSVQSIAAEPQTGAASFKYVMTAVAKIDQPVTFSFILKGGNGVQSGGVQRGDVTRSAKRFEIGTGTNPDINLNTVPIAWDTFANASPGLGILNCSAPRR